MNRETELLTQKLVDTLSDISKNETKPYDVEAEVIRIDGNIAWVHIPGGVKETPVQLTINAKKGDKVRLRVSGGTAWITGNISSPPTDDAVANVAKSQAVKAYTIADDAYSDASIAKEAANNAVESASEAKLAAETANDILDDMKDDAQAAGIEVDKIYTYSKSAKTDATAAKLAADIAEAAAGSAQKSLATVEDVVGVLNWISAHGTMTSQYGGTFDENKVYFIQDDTTPGDYHVGSHYYSIVSEPRAEDINSYYVLSVDESVQNYVTTHVYVDNEGLWLIPETNTTASNSTKKILIATGTGVSYTEAGTYIIEKISGSNVVVASFRANGTRIGPRGFNRIELDPQAMKVINANHDVYFRVFDMHENSSLSQSGTADLKAKFIADGIRTLFYLTPSAYDNSYTVTVSDSSGGGLYSKSTSSFTFNDPPNKDAIITVEYTSGDMRCVAFAYGLHDQTLSDFGALSFAEGYQTKPMGYASHTEGQNTQTYGKFTHAEGYNTEAWGEYSHAEGSEAKTRGANSHAEGEETEAYGIDSHAEGYQTKAHGNYTHTEGYYTEAYNTKQDNPNYSVGAHAEGYYTKAETKYSHAEGYYTRVYSREGQYDPAAEAAHAEGYYTEASGDYAHSEGYYTKAHNEAAHAEGYETEAIGQYSHSQNYGTKAQHRSQTVIGEFNELDTSISADEYYNRGDYAFLVGNGSDNNNRSNAMELKWNGDVKFYGNVTANNIITPEDYVVSSGNASKWRCRKWNSGRMEAWGNPTVTCPISSQTGNIYTSTQQTITFSFPSGFSFKTVDFANITVAYGSWSTWQTLAALSTTNYKVYLLSSNSRSSVTYTLYTHVTGTWK